MKWLALFAALVVVFVAIWRFGRRGRKRVVQRDNAVREQDGGSEHSVLSIDATLPAVSGTKLSPAATEQDRGDSGQASFIPSAIELTQAPLTIGISEEALSTQTQPPLSAPAIVGRQEDAASGSPPSQDDGTIQSEGAATLVADVFSAPTADVDPPLSLVDRPSGNTQLREGDAPSTFPSKEEQVPLLGSSEDLGPPSHVGRSDDVAAPVLDEGPQDETSTDRQPPTESEGVRTPQLEPLTSDVPNEAGKLDSGEGGGVCSDPLQGKDEEVTPRRYRPNPLDAPRPRVSRGSRNVSVGANSERALEIRVSTRLDRSGNLHMGVLLKRFEGGPEGLQAKISDATVWLEAFGDEWYELEALPRIGDLIWRGFLCTARPEGGDRVMWALSGREHYVLAPLQGHSALIQASRLQIGCRQVVLVRNEVAAAAKVLLTESCELGTALPELQDVVAGWTAIGPLSPVRAIAHIAGDDHLNLLRPLADLSISLAGGICVRGSEWLVGFPPMISVIGVLHDADAAMIDGKLATKLETGGLTVDGYDSIGDHVVWCAGKTIRYSIVAAPHDWQSWDCNPQSRATVCGALVQSTQQGLDQRIITVSGGGVVLIGPLPGQILRCSKRASGEWAGLVPFEPVWVLPADPYQCDKRKARIQLLVPSPLQPMRRTVSRVDRERIREWCTALLDCKRKGLSLAASEYAGLWGAYVNEAHRLYRSTAK